MITKDNAYVYPKAYNKAIRDAEQAKKDGYIEAPDWFPVPTPGYEYKIFGQMLVFMKPKPKLRHILRYRFPLRHLLLAWRARRIVRRLTFTVEQENEHGRCNTTRR